MKRILMTLLTLSTLTSTAAFSMQIEEQFDVDLGVPTALIKNPRFGDLPFSVYSRATSVNGACRALGYEKGAPGSQRVGEKSVDTVLVNDNGQVIGGYADYPMTQVICLGSRNVSNVGIPVLITGPTHQQSKIKFSAYSYASSVDGVCKVLGYEKGAPGSIRAGAATEYVVQMDEKGKVLAGRSDYPIERIICFGERVNSNSEAIQFVAEPRHPDSGLSFSGYSYRSNENGVCKVLGYTRGALGSIQVASSPTTTVQVDAEGLIKSGRQDYPVVKLICIGTESNLRGLSLNLNKTENKESSIVLMNPVHAETGLGFSSYSYASSEDGICKSLGYTKAATGSLRSSANISDTVRVDVEGNVIGGPRDYVVAQIVCIQQR